VSFPKKKHRKEAAALSEKFTKIKMEKGLGQMDAECWMLPPSGATCFAQC